MFYVAICTLCFMSLWFKDIRIFYGSFALLIAVGILTTAISPLGCLSLAVTGLLFYLYKHGTKYRLISWVALLLIGVAYGLHVIPGFNNLNYIDEVKLSERSVTFDIWFNYDKLAFGLLGVALVLHEKLIRSLSVLKKTVRESLFFGLAGIVAIYSIAVLMGYSQFDLTFKHVFWPWALKNLVFTVLAEELLFRGLLQRELTLRCPTGGYCSHFPVVFSAVLFGVAHFAGGVEYIFLSTIAGLVYGYAYKITGRIESAITIHFLLNASHFLFFAYPYSA